MATITDPTTGAAQRVDADKGAARTIIVPRGDGYALAATTGTIAAALAAGSAVFAMRLDASAPNRAFIDRIRLQWTTLVAFTTALTAGRRLELCRGSATVNPSGGTAIAVPPPKHTLIAASEFATAQGGDARIATTGALTATGTTWEATPIAVMSLAHLGAAGAFSESVFEFAACESYEVVLEPGQVLGIRAPVAMDAGGTWQLGVGVQWREAPAY